MEIVLTVAALGLIVRIPGLDRPPRRDYDSLSAIVRAGLLHLVRTPPLLGGTLIGGIGLGGLGLLTVTFPFFAVEHLDAGRGAAGYLWAAFAAGSAIGAVAFTGLQRRFAPERIMVVAIGTLGLVMLTWPLAHSVPVAMALIALGGLRTARRWRRPSPSVSSTRPEAPWPGDDHRRGNQDRDAGARRRRGGRAARDARFRIRAPDRRCRSSSWRSPWGGP